jgi:hypothetical protein
VIDRVEVEDHAILIIGGKTAPEQAIFRNSEDPAKADRGSLRKWRAGRM